MHHPISNDFNIFPKDHTVFKIMWTAYFDGLMKIKNTQLAHFK